jgi:transglycosylase-like protein
LRVRSGRQLVVLVIAFTGISLANIAGPAQMRAYDPAQLSQFMQAVAQVESHGNPTALNATSGAYGRYQIMPDNWRAWARRYLGNANAKPTLANQERVARAKMAQLYRWLGSWQRVSYWWLTGSSQTSAWSHAARTYVARVMAIFGGVETSRPSVDTTRHYSERSSTIDYSGIWHVARAATYAGGRVSYASNPGATAGITFTGSRIAWYGPVGPTRGKARVVIDGVVAKTVDLHRSTFRPRALLYSRSWAAAGRHSLVIEVLSTHGHRLVAIDELVVTP